MSAFAGQSHGASHITDGVHLEPAGSIAPMPIDWLWKGWLARGKFHVLDGAVGTGETAIAYDLAATISKGGMGRCWPDNSYCTPGNVIIWPGKAGVEDTVIPRLIAAGADGSRIFVIRSTREYGCSRGFNFATDISQLGDEIAKIGDVALVVIDSLGQAVAGDSYKHAEVHRALALLVELGVRHKCAILGITHADKSSKGARTRGRANSSSAFTAEASLVMLTVKGQSELTDEDPASCILVRASSDIGPVDGGFEYQIEAAEFSTSVGTFCSLAIRWCPIPLRGSFENILKFPETGDSPALEAAKQFLKAILADGDLPWPDIEAKARVAGISVGSLKRAKLSLRITHHKQLGAGQASPWIWHLPGPPRNYSPQGGFDNPTTPHLPLFTDGPQMPFQPSGQFRPPGWAPPLWNSVPFPQFSPFSPFSPFPLFAPIEPLAPFAPVAPVAPLALITNALASMGKDEIEKYCIKHCLGLYDNYVQREDEDPDEVIASVVSETLDLLPEGTTVESELRNTLTEQCRGHKPPWKR